MEEAKWLKLNLNPASKAKPCCRIRRKKVESPRELRIENNVKLG